MTKLFLLFLSISFTLTAAPYIEYCAGSQLKYKDAGSGGTGGHAFIYARGLCKDYSKKFPQVIPCDQLTTEQLADYPHDGVGISLDSEFKNVSWIAVPTRELTFSMSSIEDIIKNSLKYKIFEGVKLHENAAKLNAKLFSKTLSNYNIAFEKDEEENLSLSSHSFSSSKNDLQVFSTLYTIGTDIAINTGRDLACIKLEIKDNNSLNNIADYLNQVNTKYYQSNKPYVWHMLLNNCSHLSMNIINKAGFESPFYQVNPLVKSGSLAHFATALIEQPATTVKNMITPADGFKILKRRQMGESIFYPVLNQEQSFFDTNKLKVFSFDPLNESEPCIHDFTKVFTQSRLSKATWVKRNIIFGKSFYKQYKNHFYQIKDLL